MIALDSNALARFIAKDPDPSVQRVANAIESGTAYLPPVVLTELLSNPRLPVNLADVVLAVPLLRIRDGYWARAAGLRADLLRRKLKASVADCLIAQSCIDNDVPLITYDRDFRHFAAAGLKLL